MLRSQPRLDSIEDIVALVGSDETRFVVHKNLMCKGSKFFQAACRGEWKESTERLVHFPEVQPGVLSIYLGWIYTCKVDVSRDGGETGSSRYEEGTTDERHQEISSAHVHSYILGNMVIDRRFQNATIDEFILFIEGS